MSVYVNAETTPGWKKIKKNMQENISSNQDFQERIQIKTEMFLIKNEDKTNDL